MPLSSVVGAQSIVRPGVCTSSTRPASPYDGQMIYETDTNLMRVWNGSAWKTLSFSDYTNGTVLQVVSTTKTDIFTTTSTTMVDVTGMSATITPTSTSSKVFISVVFVTGNDNSSMFNAFNLQRDATNIGVATGGSSNNYTSLTYPNNAAGGWSHTINLLDSPSTVSSVTYKLRMAVPNGGTGVIGRYAANATAGATSTFTLMEIAG